MKTVCEVLNVARSHIGLVRTQAPLAKPLGRRPAT